MSGSNKFTYFFTDLEIRFIDKELIFSYIFQSRINLYSLLVFDFLSIGNNDIKKIIEMKIEKGQQICNIFIIIKEQACLHLHFLLENIPIKKKLVIQI